MTEQEFYEHIAKNYTKIHKYALKYVKRLAKNEYVWDEYSDCWFPDFDEWDGFDEHTDLNFWVKSEDLSGTDCWLRDETEDGTTLHTEMRCTAYFYKNEQVVTDVYVNIFGLKEKK